MSPRRRAQKTAAKDQPAKPAGDSAAEERHQYEFFGPPGAIFITFVLPLVVYSLAFFCNDVSGCPAPSLLHPSRLNLLQLKHEIGWPEEGIVGLFDLDVFGKVLGYYLLLLLLQIFLPGTTVEGVQLACGGRHKYKMNTGLGAGTYMYGPNFPVWPFIWKNHIQIITSNILIATTIAIFCYARSFTVPARGKPNSTNRELAPGGITGNAIYDFFIGRELNPRITLPIPFVDETTKTIDLKVFCELRPCW
ncbi:Delta(24)-sterol C-methyltransferase, partial [Ascosphaera pollenicola]